ncbi:MAG: chromate transporter [Paludibacteraceae bacterium]|nr:chromate transporter [Paludibacteraceae bacterium]MBP6284375.1 chromate transporter [Paludibacteraceae bacterium]
MKQVTIWQLFSTFLKIGAFTFGGGYAMLSIIEQEIVHKRKWLNKDEYTEMLALVQTAPGPISLNSAVFIGYKLGKWKGTIATALGVILPSFIIILGIAFAFVEISENPTVERIFKGIRPAVVALIAVPVMRMIQTSGITWKTAIIPIAAVVVIWVFGFSPIYVVVGAILLGLTVQLIQQRKKGKP